MTDVASIIQALPVCLAAIALIFGIDAWKREFVGKRRIELAEEVLAKFFEVKDAIAYIRNPFSTKDEGKSRERSPSEVKDDEELLDRGYIVVDGINEEKRRSPTSMF